MSNIQKLNQKLAELGVLNPQVLSGVIATPIDNREPLSVALVQINNSFSGQNYLPYAAGLLQAYVEKYAKHPERYKFRLPVYSRAPVNQTVEHLLGADVIGFSAYVWNINISLEVARRIKAEKPETLVVFGGPQVPDKAEKFLRDHPFIDITVHGEGEPIFLGLLENFPSRTWAGVPSISFIEDDKFIHNHRAERLKDISVVPSPYLEGTFHALMKANPSERWLILWETNRGCPFRCTFCDWGSAIAAKVSQFEIDRLLREVDWFAEHKIEFIFCCDANYGMLARDYEITQYVADTKGKLGFPKALSVQNTKNGLERAYKVQKLLSDAGLNKGVSLSLQSVDPMTLEAIKRDNISTETYQELQRRFTRDRVETYSDLILGLPGETYDSFANGVSTVIENGQHNRIQFNNLSILPNAEMGDPEYQKKFGMEIIESTIINIHGSLSETKEEIPETQQLVVATSSMPRSDWVRTRAFCWMTAFLHFDKVLQIPLIIVREASKVSYRQLLEAFIDDRSSKYPILSGIKAFFEDEACKIQSGGPEYCHSEEWLDIFWPADEYALIKLCKENTLADFYAECEDLLSGFLISKSIELPDNLLHEAVELNRNLIKLPFQKENLEFDTSSNIWEFYRGVLTGEHVDLASRSCVNRIDRTTVTYGTWEDWYREVIWYGNKKGAYLYGNEAVDREIAGHY